ncbi:Putative transposable element, partial [Caligus rogercresseyi]
MKQLVRTPRLTKVVTGKIHRNPARSMNKIAQEYYIFARSIGRVVKADLDMKPIKYRRIHLLNEATRVKRKARSNGTQTTLKLFETSKKFNSQNDRILFRIASKITDKYQKRLPDAEAGICDCLGAVASNGKKSSWLRITDGVKINKIVYLDFLKTKVFPWIQEKFGGVPVCFQQDGAQTHTEKTVQDWCAANSYHFWSKDLWPTSSPDCSPLDFA